MPDGHTRRFFSRDQIKFQSDACQTNIRDILVQGINEISVEKEVTAALNLYTRGGKLTLRNAKKTEGNVLGYPRCIEEGRKLYSMQIRPNMGRGDNTFVAQLKIRRILDVHNKPWCGQQAHIKRVAIRRVHLSRLRETTDACEVQQQCSRPRFRSCLSIRAPSPMYQTCHALRSQGSAVTTTRFDRTALVYTEH